MTENILLETGTGEVELLEFLVSKKHYCINVLKIKEIVQLENIVPIPGEKPEVAGKAVVRDMMVSVIDLNRVLEKKPYEPSERCIGILCEFNQSVVVFLVDTILGIKRVKWTELKSPDDLTEESLVVATILSGKDILMLLDFEQILISITSKDTNRYYKKDKNMSFNRKRKDIKLILADDSKMIRSLLKETLTQSGYTHLTFFNNGLEAYTYLENLKETEGSAFKESVELLITDIEMPAMDGYTLTRKIKEDEVLDSLPVVIFSSLITKDLFHKGKRIGTDAQISKPEIGKLVETIDGLVGI